MACHRGHKSFVLSALFVTLLCGVLISRSSAQIPNPCTGTGVCVLTWQQDNNLPSGSTCSGCSYRTGENLNETQLIPQNISPDTFGKLCTIPVDGQVYAQPLVVTNVNWKNQGTPINVAYVVTHNDTIYAINATPSGNCANNVLLAQSLLPTGQTPVPCSQIGAQDCETIWPQIGILGTPVINITGSTGTIYLVTYSQDTVGNFYHYLHALDMSTLQDTVPAIQICKNGCGTYTSGSDFSRLHIQRPGLLYANGSVYVGFSMMDGTPSPSPNGWLFRYDGTLNYQASFPTSQGTTNSEGGGIWMGGGAPAYGTDEDGNGPFIFLATANGTYNPSATPTPGWGESMLKLDPNTLAVLGSFTPSDFAYRDCADEDLGSGSVMLLPDDEINPHYAIGGDKEGGIWFYLSS